MRIWNDYSYIDSMFGVESGYAKIDVHSLRLRVVPTEKQMEANRTVAAQTLDRGDRDAWTAHCKAAQKRNASMVLPVVTALSERLEIYQFTDTETVPFNGKWDLFFWCNHDYDEGGRDYSYVTLNFNDEHMTYEERQEVLTNVITILNSLESNVDVAVQHDLYWDKERVQEAVSAYCEAHVGEFIQYGRVVGKIRRVKGGYGFFKKGAKKYGVLISGNDIEILQLALRIQ